MLVWLRKQVRRLGEVSRGWCRPDWGNKRWASESGEYIRCMPPWGVLHLLFVAVKLGPKCSLQMHKGGERQLNIPLNLLFYCRNVLRQPLLPHQPERRKETKEGVRVLRGLSNLRSSNTLDKRWGRCFQIDYLTRKVFSAKMRSLVLLEVSRVWPECISSFSPLALQIGRWWFDPKWDGKDSHSHHLKKQVRQRWNIEEFTFTMSRSVNLRDSTPRI